MCWCSFLQKTQRQISLCSACVLAATASLNSRLPPMREHDAAIQDGCMLRVAVSKARPRLAVKIEVTMRDGCAAGLSYFLYVDVRRTGHHLGTSLRTPWVGAGVESRIQKNILEVKLEYGRCGQSYSCLSVYQCTEYTRYAIGGLVGGWSPHTEANHHTQSGVAKKNSVFFRWSAPCFEFAANDK